MTLFRHVMSSHNLFWYTKIGPLVALRTIMGEFNYLQKHKRRHGKTKPHKNLMTTMKGSRKFNLHKVSQNFSWGPQLKGISNNFLLNSQRYN